MPNIVICGTPGTGKSTIVAELKKSLPDYKFINLSEYAIEHKHTLDRDERLDTHVIDEDKVLSELEPILEKSDNHVIEYMHGDMFRTNLVDWVFVCRTDIELLGTRLEQRGYNEEKIRNNIDAEIFQEILDESIEFHGDQKVTQLVNHNLEDLEHNVKLILDKIDNLKDAGSER